jgi:hypothetical protein
MKILFHHRIRSKDGQFVHLEELSRALVRLGHEIILIGPAAIEKEEFGSDAGLIDALKKNLPAFVYELLEFAYSIPAFLRLWRAARRHRPDGIASSVPSRSQCAIAPGAQSLWRSPAETLSTVE